MRENQMLSLTGKDSKQPYKYGQRAKGKHAQRSEGSREAMLYKPEDINKKIEIILINMENPSKEGVVPEI